MNQILVNKKENKKKRYIFKVQIFISIALAIIMFILFLNNYKKISNQENLSKVLEKTYGLNYLYNAQKINSNSNYFGKIYINKINLEYIIFNEFNEELLNIAPCKFYGVNMGEEGNICISAHNYNDERFFGRLKELHVDDEIILENLECEKFIYKIYTIFETTEDDLSILEANKKIELTLVTCNNSNNRRIIVKSYQI